MGEITMVQVIEQQGNIFGRIGKGLGQGLAEQLPKEVERNRLSTGLKQFEQDMGGLNPTQQLARLSSIPGVTPQMIQTFGELAKQQNTRNAYANVSKGKGASPSQQNEGPSIRDMKFAGFDQNEQQRQGQPQKANDMVRPEESGQPQVVNTNPLRPEAQIRGPWTPQQRNEHKSQLYDDFPNLTPSEIDTMAADDERRWIDTATTEQKKDSQLEGIQDNLRKKFHDQLQTKLQKSTTGEIFKDVTGEMLVNMERGIERDLRLNPEASPDDVINKWSTKALDLAKTKSQLSELSRSKSFFPIVTNKKEYENKLKTYSKIFKETGNSEEYFNLLKKDFDLSPQGASYIAFERSRPVQEYVSTIKGNGPIHNFQVKSRKYAADIEGRLTSGDSLLGIARDFREKDPYFDQNSFFDQLREDQDNIMLNPRQRRELAEGVSGILPSWGDVLFLPFFRGL